MGKPHLQFCHQSMTENYERLIWIDEGSVQADGIPRGVIKKYQDAMYKYREKNI